MLLEERVDHPGDDLTCSKASIVQLTTFRIETRGSGETDCLVVSGSSSMGSR